MGDQINVIYEMETQDPDDLFALCLLASHPQVNLLGVTVVPGSVQQIGLIEHILRDRLDLPDVPVGGHKLNHPKDCISRWWTGFLGEHPAVLDAPQGADVIARVVRSLKSQKLPLTYISGAPIKNLGEFLEVFPEHEIDRWVAQGGFVGANLVPEKYQLHKFVGQITCQTWNFNGDHQSTQLALKSDKIKLRQLIGKNVCHGVYYNRSMHDLIKSVRNKPAGLQLMYDGMDRYLKKNPGGKKFHDPLAVCVAIQPDLAWFREVEVYRGKGGWGCEPRKGSNTFAAITIDHQWKLIVCCKSVDYVIPWSEKDLTNNFERGRMSLRP